jgi:transcriptional regulator with XRE-family HTH domain
MEKSIYTREHEILHRLLRQVRMKAGLTQVQLAKKLKLTQSLFSKMERGDCRLDTVQLRTICQALGVGLLEFIGRYEQELAKRK